ncbi:hypothetical protein LguiA_024360 [Lonicera macranthoides]
MNRIDQTNQRQSKLHLVVSKLPEDPALEFKGTFKSHSILGFNLGVLINPNFNLILK